MAKKAKYKYIPCDIYKRGVFLFIGSLRQFKDWVKEEFTYKDEEDFVNMVLSLEEGKVGMASFNYDYNNGQSAILIPKYPTTPKETAALAHELLHATFFIMDFCRVEYVSNSNNEAFTYLHEHLVRNAFETTGYKNYTKQNTKEQ